MPGSDSSWQVFFAGLMAGAAILGVLLKLISMLRQRSRTERTDKRERDANAIRTDQALSTRREAESLERVATAVETIAPAGPGPARLEPGRPGEHFRVKWGTVLGDRPLDLGEFHNAGDVSIVFNHAEMPASAEVSAPDREVRNPEVLKVFFGDTELLSSDKEDYQHGRFFLRKDRTVRIQVRLRFASNQPFTQMVVRVPYRSSQQNSPSTESPLEIKVHVSPLNRHQSGFPGVTECLNLAEDLRRNGPRTIEDLRHEWCDSPGSMQTDRFADILGGLLQRNQVEERDDGRLHAVKD